MLERFIKRPNDFKFQRFRIKGLKASIFNKYAEVLKAESAEKTILSLAEPLAKKMSIIPEYTKKTKEGLSKKQLELDLHLISLSLLKVCFSRIYLKH